MNSTRIHTFLAANIQRVQLRQLLRVGFQRSRQPSRRQFLCTDSKRVSWCRQKKRCTGYDAR